MPVSKYRAAAADDVVTGNFWALPLLVVLAFWGYAAVTAAARMNANINLGNRIELSGCIGAQFALQPQRDCGNRAQVILLMPEYFGVFQVGSISAARRLQVSSTEKSWALSRRSQFSCSVSVTYGVSFGITTHWTRK